MENIILSIIVPIFNGEKYIDQLMSCLKKQILPFDTKLKVEYLFIDDGSTDDSYELLQHYSDYFPNIRIIHQNNRGVAAARNTGISESKGQFLSFIDVDDKIESDMLKIIFSTINDQDDLIFYARKKYAVNTYELHRNIDNIEVCNRILDFNKTDYLDDRWIYPSSWSKIFKKSFIVAHSLRFQETLQISEDLEFLLKCCLHTINIAFCENGFYTYIQHNNSAIHRGRKDSLRCAIKLYEYLQDDAKINTKIQTAVAYHILMWSLIAVGNEYGMCRRTDSTKSQVRKLKAYTSSAFFIQSYNAISYFKHGFTIKDRMKLWIIKNIPILIIIILRAKYHILYRK